MERSGSGWRQSSSIANCAAPAWTIALIATVSAIDRPVSTAPAPKAKPKGTPNSATPAMRRMPALKPSNVSIERDLALVTSAQVRPQGRLRVNPRSG